VEYTCLYIQGGLHRVLRNSQSVLICTRRAQREGLPLLHFSQAGLLRRGAAVVAVAQRTGLRSSCRLQQCARERIESSDRQFVLSLHHLAPWTC
jgi:hypothetical protein